MTDAALTDAPATAAKDIGTRAAAAGGDLANVTAAVVTIARSPHELYAAWRDFSKLAGIMENVERIEVTDDRRSTWTIKSAGDRTVSWQTEVTEDDPDRAIAWKSAEGSAVTAVGRVEFRAVEGRGSVVRAVIGYDVPGGAVGQFVAKLFQREPAIQTRRDLRRFKQHMETGEVATSARTRGHAAENKAG